jgi:hypothetical protein
MDALRASVEAEPSKKRAAAPSRAARKTTRSHGKHKKAS